MLGMRATGASPTPQPTPTPTAVPFRGLDVQVVSVSVGVLVAVNVRVGVNVRDGVGVRDGVSVIDGIRSGSGGWAAASVRRAPSESASAPHTVYFQ